ncbi:hypothetical protein DPMN_012171 [Dreissena polymorpha]|uniref:Uncharacterized protein n=1 Tax=Dreissena polymorpha TaxID=45954 RepID=A0A9D4N6H1_DREPO|nr:hypothetical protein DPMN_012171 [Dreissena polymorpha]
MGDSIPYWAGQRAELQGMPDLNLPVGTRVVWMGVSGMRWADAVHHIQLPALFRMPPKVLVVHLGVMIWSGITFMSVLNTFKIRLNITSGISGEHYSLGKHFAKI